MSAQSSIAIQNNDGTVRAIYCHSDGYPSHNGKILLENYNTEEKVNDLLDLGDISFLNVHVEPQKELEECKYDWRASGLVRHSFDTPHKNVTIAYGRDRGETDIEAKEYASEDEWVEARRETYWADYIYLFKNGKWYMDGEELTEEIIEQD